MKRSFAYCFTLVGIFAAALFMAAAADAGCSPEGSWMSFQEGENGDIPLWISTNDGQSASSGTVVLEFPDLDVTGGGAFSTAVRTSQYRGSWKKTGGNTFNYTFLGYAVDANGAPVYISKISGTGTLSQKCDTVTVTAFEDIFFPGNPACDNPFEDEPCVEDIDLGVSTAYRVTVE